MKKSKCLFMAPEVEYLGHKINSEGLHLTQNKIKPSGMPSSPKVLQSWSPFLGFWAITVDFCPMCPLHSHLSIPSCRQTKDGIWFWGEKHQAAFEAAKDLLESSVLVVHYDSTKKWILACDTCSIAIWCQGCVVPWDEGWIREANRFFIKDTGPCQKELFSTRERGPCDHLWCKKVSHGRPLCQLFSESKGVLAIAASQIQHWALTLSAYKYSITYRPGKNHLNADTLSCLPLLQEINVLFPGELHIWCCNI